MWLFNGKEVIEPPKGMFGFVYCITNHTNDKKYIGRKYFWSSRKVKGSKRKKTSESDWKTYWGSCEPLLEDIKQLGEENFTREILHFHDTKGQVNYWEIAEQFKLNVLHELNENGERAYYNRNIMSRYFAPSEESHKKQAESLKKRFALMTEEEREAYSKRCSKAMTPEVRDAISMALKGFKHSEETKKNLRGRIPWNKGIDPEVWAEKLGNNFVPPPSQKGKIRITDGIEEALISKDSIIPDGWKKGRAKTSLSGKPCTLYYCDGTTEKFPSGAELRKHFKMHLNVFNRLLHRPNDRKRISEKWESFYMIIQHGVQPDDRFTTDNTK